MADRCARIAPGGSSGKPEGLNILRARPAVTWTLALLAASFWLLLHPYQGLSGDAALNALTSLAETGEPALAGDLYLRGGGHGIWSSIGPSYAPASTVLGIERSARLSSLLGSLLWLGALFMLARRCLPTDRAMLALALTITLGASVAPYLLADFLGNSLTARLPAGALVLMGLALQLGNRWRLAAVCLALATWLHPLIGASGLLTWLGTRLSRNQALGIGAALLTLVLVMAVLQSGSGSEAASLGQKQWLQWVRSREGIRFPSEWSGATWWAAAAALVPTWLLSHGLASDRAARLLRSAVGCGLLGVTAAALVAWVAPGSPLFAVEVSRWLWIPQALLGIAAAGGLMPLIQRGPPTGNPIWLGLGGWLLPGWPGLALLCAALLLWCLQSRCAASLLDSLRLPCMAIFGLCSLLWLRDTLPFQGWSVLLSSGVTATAFVALSCWSARQPLFAAPAVATGLCFLAAVVPTAATQLSRPEFAAANAGSLSEWRAVIPEDAEVFWPERPQASWFILGRKSYLAKLQSRAVSQSPATAAKLYTRSLELTGTLPPAILFSNSPVTMLFRTSEFTIGLACRDSSTDFMVSEKALRLQLAAAPLELNWNHSQSRITAYLYDCRQLRDSSSLAPDAR